MEFKSLKDIVLDEVVKLTVVDPVSGVKSVDPDALSAAIALHKVLSGIKIAVLPDGPPDPGKVQ